MQPEVAANMLPVLRKFMFLCSERWNSEASITTITIPTLVLVGTEDTLVPPSMAERLFDVRPPGRRTSQGIRRARALTFVSCDIAGAAVPQAAGAPAGKKQMVHFEGGTHNDTVAHRDYFKAVATFWKRYVADFLDVGDEGDD